MNAVNPYAVKWASGQGHLLFYGLWTVSPMLCTSRACRLVVCARPTLERCSPISVAPVNRGVHAIEYFNRYRLFFGAFVQDGTPDLAIGMLEAQRDR